MCVLHSDDKTDEDDDDTMDDDINVCDGESDLQSASDVKPQWRRSALL